MHSIRNHAPLVARSIDNSLKFDEAAVISLEGTADRVQADVNINVSHNQDEHVASEIQQEEVHPSKSIQHRLDLRARVRQYDERLVAEDFTLVLSRKHKQKIKLQQVLPKQPIKTRAWGDPSTTAK